MKKYVQLEFDFGDSPKPADETRMYLVELTDGWNGETIESSDVVGTWEDACDWISRHSDPEYDIWWVAKTEEGTTIVDFGSHEIFGRIS